MPDLELTGKEHLAAAAGTVAIWSGGTVAADTLFSCNTCWGDCGSAPICGVDANRVSNLRQPCVTVNSSVMSNQCRCYIKN